MKRFLLLFYLFSFSLLNAFDSTVPVLHLPDYYQENTKQAFLEKLEYALHEVGFFALTGTGIDAETLDQTYELAKDFFALEPFVKQSLITKDGQRGYVASESPKGGDKKDFKEFYHIGRELSEADLQRLQYAKNVWTEQPEGFQDSMQNLYKALDSCKNAIGNMFSEALGQEKNYLNEMIREGDALMRVIHYPSNPPSDSIWAGAHTDINLFTILPRSTAQGLQILNQEGEWIDVIVPDGAFIINSGDMLENLSNGYFRSAMHRVIDPGLGQERYSVVFFVHPRSEDRLDPLSNMILKTGGIRKYANVTRLELLAERLIDLRLASPELMEFFFQSGAIKRLQEVGRFSPKAQNEMEKKGYMIDTESRFY